MRCGGYRTAPLWAPIPQGWRCSYRGLYGVRGYPSTYGVRTIRQGLRKCSCLAPLPHSLRLVVGALPPHRSTHPPPLPHFPPQWRLHSACGACRFVVPHSATKKANPLKRRRCFFFAPFHFVGSSTSLTLRIRPLRGALRTQSLPPPQRLPPLRISLPTPSLSTSVAPRSHARDRLTPMPSPFPSLYDRMAHPPTPTAKPTPPQIKNKKYITDNEPVLF